MNFKNTVVRALLRWVDGWNKEIHSAIEANVFSEHNKMFPGGSDGEKIETRINDMRTFYYARLTNTANLLVACVAVLVSIVALFVSIVAIIRSSC